MRQLAIKDLRIKRNSFKNLIKILEWRRRKDIKGKLIQGIILKKNFLWQQVKISIILIMINQVKETGLVIISHKMKVKLFKQLWSQIVKSMKILRIRMRYISKKIIPNKMLKRTMNKKNHKLFKLSQKSLKYKILKLQTFNQQIKLLNSLNKL